MKYRVLLFNYLKEKKFYIAIFMVNTFIVYSFYKFTVSSEAEIIYPLIITVFFLCVFLIVDFYRYVQLIKCLKGGLDKCKENLRGGTFLENSIFKVIDNERVNLICNLEDMKVKYDTREKFIIASIHKLKNNMSVMETTLEYMNLNQELINDEVLKKDFIENRVEINNTESLDSLKGEVQETKEVLNNTLSYIRLGSFNEDFQIEEINFYEELKEIINCNRRLFTTAEVFPKLETDDKDIKVVTDIKWNRVLVEQIISNAIKYSKAGKKINLKVYREDNKVLLEIVDHGIGITDYDLKKVFNPYFTGENGRRNNKSTGIGLFIAKGICKALDQSIEITSTVGVGTKVKITYLSKL